MEGEFLFNPVLRRKAKRVAQKKPAAYGSPAIRTCMKLLDAEMLFEIPGGGCLFQWLNKGSLRSEAKMLSG
ncbi:MAG: hypothetical protein Kow0027_13300 [Saprospiraceae bacterium]